MTNMFKKTLVATALFSVAGAVSAAEIVATPSWFANELVTTAAVDATTGIATHAATATALQVGFTYRMKANYTINDTITFTFTGTAISPASLPNNVNNGAAADDEIVLSRISSAVVDGNVVATYRVTKIGDNVINDTVDEEFDFVDLALRPRNLTGALRVSYVAQTATGLPLDNTGGATLQNPILANVAQQFAALSVDSTDNFAAVVDVNEQRTQFDGAEPALEMEVVNNLPDAAAFVANGSTTLTHFNYTINGDFSWLLDEDGDVDADVATVTIGGCAVVPAQTVIDAGKIAFRCTNAAAATVAIAIDAENEVVIPDQSFTVDTSVAFVAGATNGTKTLANAATGSWTLNGSKVYIPYMLYGPTAEQTIQLTNQGTQSGDIFATAVVGGNTLDLGKVGVSNARTVRSLNAAIRNAMVAKGVNLSGPGNFAVGLTLVTNVPAADVTVYSAYQRGNGDRLVVVNDSNGK